MCGMWRILPVSCWGPLAGRFFSGCWEAWRFPALAEKDQIFFFFFFWSFMGKFYIFERGQISRVGSETSCLWSLPPHWSKASRCSVYLSAWSVGQSPAWEGGKVSQSLTLDTIPVVVPCLEAAEGPPLMGSVSVRFPSVCCRAPDTSLVCLPCATKKAVEQLQLYLPALDLNSEVKDFLYLITIPLSHLNALDFLF